MTAHTDVREAGLVVRDPLLSPWQRRWFHQPAIGPARRAFTAGGAARRPGPVGRGLARWDAVCERSTRSRRRAVWF